jgi:hypothetical protein
MSKKIEEAKLILNGILTQWDEFSTRLQNMKEEELEVDLYSEIDLLTQLDGVQGTLSSQIPLLESRLKQMKETDPPAEELEQIDALTEESQDVLTQIKSKLEETEESYHAIAEKVLSRCEDRITLLVDKILEQRQETDSLKRQIDLEIDEENELRDLRDSLESYREIRLENIKERSDDLIIDQLESQMLACDSTLLIDESST